MSQPEYTWGRLRTSQWHIVHSVRAGSDGEEFILTQDGEYLPTMRRKWSYPEGRAKNAESTGAKLFTGHRPRGPVCQRCSSFVYNLERSVGIA